MILSHSFQPFFYLWSFPNYPATSSFYSYPKPHQFIGLSYLNFLKILLLLGSSLCRAYTYLLQSSQKYNVLGCLAYWGPSLNTRFGSPEAISSWISYDWVQVRLQQVATTPNLTAIWRCIDSYLDHLKPHHLVLTHKYEPSPKLMGSLLYLENAD